VIFCLLVDGIKSLSLNLSKLDFIDATGLRAVLAVRELCEHRGQAFSLTRPTGQVRRLFELAGAGCDLPPDAVPATTITGEIRPVTALPGARRTLSAARL
jgi:anti-anti-sigma factor